jgi:hypothetical protein
MDLTPRVFAKIREGRGVQILERRASNAVSDLVQKIKAEGAADTLGFRERDEV